MVEVHLVRFEGFVAIRAGTPSQLAEQSERSVLPFANSLKLAFSVPGVIGDVVGSLIPNAGHVLR